MLAMLGCLAMWPNLKLTSPPPFYSRPTLISFKLQTNTEANYTARSMYKLAMILYLSIGFVFCCFGQTNKQMDLQTCITLAFEAIASSSGDIQT